MAAIPMKDKFNTILSSFGYGSVSMDDIDQASQSCSDLCDQFAVEFGEWVSKNAYRYEIFTPEGRKWGNMQSTDQYTTAELLQLFKNRDNEK